MAKYSDWITEEGLIKIEGWARDGLIDKQIAQNAGVSERTFTEWKKRFPSLSAVLKRGKEIIDRQVENALLKRAMGYTTVEVVNKFDDEGNPHAIKQTIKEVPADTTAQIFWLKNRKPKEWRDQKNIEMSGNVSNLTDKQLNEKLKKIKGVTDE